MNRNVHGRPTDTSGIRRRAGLLAAFIAVCFCVGMFPKIRLPKLPPPEQYGTVVMDDRTKSENTPPVYFSHWSHRVRYTCRVCHSELGFSFTRGGTGITMDDIRDGLFCGECHDGTTAFAPDDEKKNCKRCHGKSALPSRAMFDELKAQLPAADFGNRIDWARALDQGLTSPKNSLRGYYRPLDLKKELVWTPPIPMVPKVHFPHKLHTLWLDCESCHPDIFDVKLQGTRRFSKKESLKGKFCGTCHLRIAFPFDDCTRCHINKMPD